MAVLGEIYLHLGRPAGSELSSAQSASVIKQCFLCVSFYLCCIDNFEAEVTLRKLNIDKHSVRSHALGTCNYDNGGLHVSGILFLFYLLIFMFCLSKIQFVVPSLSENDGSVKDPLVVDAERLWRWMVLLLNS